MSRFRRQPPSFSYGLFLRQVNDQFGPMLGDDEIKAAAVVNSGPSPYRVILLTALSGPVLSWLFGVTGTSAALMHSHRFWLAELAVTAPYVFVALPALLLQKSMLLAVTTEQVLVSRWSTLRERGSRVSLTPTNSTMITAHRRRWTTTVAVEGQGTGPIRLHAIRTHRAELEQVLAAAYAAGALVDTSAAVPGLA